MASGYTIRRLKSACLRLLPDAGFNVKKAFEFIRLGKAKAIFDKLNKYIEKHKEDEFTDKYGEVRLVGNSVLLNWVQALRRTERTRTSGTLAEFLSTGNRQLRQIADDEVHAGLYRSTQRNRRGRRR